jgi:hypothetical protein
VREDASPPPQPRLGQKPTTPKNMSERAASSSFITSLQSVVERGS